MLDRLSLPLAPGPDAFRKGGWTLVQNWPAALATAFSGFDASFDITAATASLGGFAVSRLGLQGEGNARGFLCRRLAADLPGAHVELSGDLARDGGIGDGRLDLAAADAAALKLPVRLPPGLWQGPLHVALTASGPAQAIAGQLRGDLGDLRAEAELALDTQAPALAATFTLRHPGAPRLLELAGWPGAGAWLGQGSVAFLAHVRAAPGQPVAGDFSLGAGALRLNGQLQADVAAADPVVTGTLDAPALTLPAADTTMNAALPLSLVQGWQGQLKLNAAHILAGLQPAADNAAASLTVANGVALVESVSVDLAGGHFAGTAAADTTVRLPVVALQGSLSGGALDNVPALPGLVLQGGTLDGAADLTAAGHSPAALLATLAGTVHGALARTALLGIDLPALTRLLLARGPRLRTALAAQLSSGQTGELTGAFDAAIDNGAWTFGGATFTGDAGSIAVSGTIDLPSHAPDLLLRALPAVPKPPVLTVRVVGGKRSVNAQPGVAWAGKK